MTEHGGTPPVETKLAPAHHMRALNDQFTDLTGWYGLTSLIHQPALLEWHATPDAPDTVLGFFWRQVAGARAFRQTIHAHE